MKDKDLKSMKLDDDVLGAVSGGNGEEIKIVCPNCGCPRWHGKHVYEFTTVYCDECDTKFDISEYFK